jgi:hypothetical protein
MKLERCRSLGGVRGAAAVVDTIADDEGVEVVITMKQESERAIMEWEAGVGITIQPAPPHFRALARQFHLCGSPQTGTIPTTS